MGNHVLIVDDSATMRKIIMRGLRQAGVKVAEFKEAGDGQEGLAALKRGRFNLILSDVNMPNMNGLDFVAALKDQLGDAAPPVVMITTEGSDEVIKEARKRGAKGYLKKPFTSEKIQEVLGPFLK